MDDDKSAIDNKEVVETPEAEQETELEDIEISLDETDDESLTDDESEQPDESESKQEEPKVSDEKEVEPKSESEEDTAKDDKRDAARKAFQEREAKRLERQKAQQEYLKEATDDKDLALRELQIQAYDLKVQGNIDRLEVGIQKATANIDLFKDGTPEVKEALAEALDDFENFYVVKNEVGDPIEVKADVYQYLQMKAKSIRKLTSVGARQKVKDTSETKSRAMKPPSQAPKKEVDQDLEDFDKAWDS